MTLRRISRSVAAVAALFLSSTLAWSQSLTGEVMDQAVQAELAELAPTAEYRAFIHFGQGSKAAQDQLLSAHGLVTVKDFRRYATSVFVAGPAEAFRTLAQHDWVTYVEHNTPIRLFGETQSWATRVRVAQEPVSGGPYYADNEKTQILDGTGITLGIIDSGVFGAHPDFAENLLYNYQYAEPDHVDLGKTNSESAVGGHGTHVTGTVGGSGAASEGTYAGAAPKADLIH